MQALIRTTAILCCSCSLIGIAAPLRAQVQAPPAKVGGEDSPSSEIIVTAEKRSARVQDVPIAITALPAAKLQSAGITSTVELKEVTPGLNIVTASGNVVAFLRGVGNNNVGPGSESSVATYVDGVYYSSVSSTLIDLGGVSQVEVLKGPQGTLFGRNATGGVIQIKTFDPSHEFGGNATVGYGNYGTAQARFYVTGGLADTLAANLAVGYAHQGNGYGTDLTTGNDTNKTKSIAARGKLKWEPGPQTSVVLAGDYSNVRSSVGLARRPTYDTVPLGAPRFTGGKEDSYSDVDQFATSRQGGASLTVDQKAGDLSLRSITAYRREIQHFVVDGDSGLPAPISVNDGRKVSDQYSEELQVLGPSNSRFKWVAGLFGFYTNQAYDPLLLTGTSVLPLAARAIDTRQKVTAGAAFGQVTAQDLLLGANLTVGGRYTIEHRSLDLSIFGQNAAGATVGSVLNTRGNKTWKSPSWRLALDRKFGSGVLGYISYNRGFKSGLFNITNYPASSVRPEKLDAYEAGVKLDLFAHRLSVNAAAFHYYYKDLQVPRYSQGIVLLSNAGVAKIDGLELDATYSPTRSFQLGAGLALLDPRYSSFTASQISSPRPGGGNIVQLGDASGKRLILAPKRTANASVTYRLPKTAPDIAFALNYYYNSGWYGNPDNRLRQTSFNQLNASASYTLPGGRFTLTFWARNLTNEVYADLLTGTGTFADQFAASPPRTYGATASAKF